MMMPFVLAMTDVLLGTTAGEKIPTACVFVAFRNYRMRYKLPARVSYDCHDPILT